MIPVTCPCCEAPHRPHNPGCAYAADCPSEEADWAEVASLRREVVLLNAALRSTGRSVEALRAWDDINVRVNNEHAKTQAALRAEIAWLQAEVERHRMTERERAAVVYAGGEFTLLAGVKDDDVAQANTERAKALWGYLVRTAPPAES